MTGNFKINLNVSGQQIPQDFFSNVICEAEMIEGKEEEVTLSNFSRNGSEIRYRSIQNIKKTFNKDKTLSVRFSKNTPLIKMKIFFYHQATPTTKVYLTNNGNDIIEF